MIKKILLLNVILLLSMQMIGCSEVEMRHGTVYTTEKANLMNERIMECINNEDSEGLVELFSRKSQNEIDDLNKQAEDLITAIDGKRVIAIDGCDPGYAGADYAQPLDIDERCNVLLNTGEVYNMDVTFCDIDDDHPDRLGIYYLSIWNCTADEFPDNSAWDKIDSSKDGIFFVKIK